jgi:23S rRNA (cytidine2498-2'-O)-methyltransferase
MPGVTFRKGNAFAIKPEEVGPLDWIFSDVVCYPEKLLEWVKIWMESGNCKNFICTLKFQGEGGYEVVKEFAKIPGSEVLHLGYNKHELTWICVKNSIM